MPKSQSRLQSSLDNLFNLSDNLQTSSVLRWGSISLLMPLREGGSFNEAWCWDLAFLFSCPCYFNPAALRTHSTSSMWRNTATCPMKARLEKAFIPGRVSLKTWEPFIGQADIDKRESLCFIGLLKQYGISVKKDEKLSSDNFYKAVLCYVMLCYWLNRFNQCVTTVTDSYDTDALASLILHERERVQGSKAWRKIKWQSINKEMILSIFIW